MLLSLLLSLTGYLRNPDLTNDYVVFLGLMFHIFRLVYYKNSSNVNFLTKGNLL